MLPGRIVVLLMEQLRRTWRVLLRILRVARTLSLEWKLHHVFRHELMLDLRRIFRIAWHRWWGQMLDHTFRQKVRKAKARMVVAIRRRVEEIGGVGTARGRIFVDGEVLVVLRCPCRGISELWSIAVEGKVVVVLRTPRRGVAVEDEILVVVRKPRRSIAIEAKAVMILMGEVHVRHRRRHRVVSDRRVEAAGCASRNALRVRGTTMGCSTGAKNTRSGFWSRCTAADTQRRHGHLGADEQGGFELRRLE
jgi:hypothetical protein